MIATFMPKPFGHLTGNGCHFHMSLWKDGENVFEVDDPSDDPRGLGLQRDRLQLHRRAEEAREGVHRADRADGLLVQAAQDRHAQRLELGAGVRELRLQQPDPDAAHPGGRPDRGPHGRRLMQPLPRRHGGARRRPRRDRERPRRRRPDHRAEPPRADRGRSARSSASSCCPRTCSTRPASSSRTTCCAPRSARRGTRTTWTTTSRRSRTSSRSGTTRSRRGRSSATCSCSSGSGSWRPPGAVRRSTPRRLPSCSSSSCWCQAHLRRDCADPGSRIPTASCGRTSGRPRESTAGALGQLLDQQVHQQAVGPLAVDQLERRMMPIGLKPTAA